MEAKTIFVSSLDRLSRSINNLIVDMRRLKKMGFGVYVVDRQETLDLDSKNTMNVLLYEEK